MSVSLYGSGNTVIQVVQATSNTSTSTTSSTYVTTGLSASITPQSTTSKILIIVQGVIQSAPSHNTNITIYRGTVSGTDLSGTSGGVGFGYVTNAGSATNTNQNPIISYLDSPSTTSSTTYTFAFKTDGGTIYNSINSTVSTITLLEISGS
jgi:hypothetical protein